MPQSKRRKRRNKPLVPATGEERTRHWDGTVIYVGKDGETFKSDPLTAVYAEWDDVVWPLHVAAAVAKIRAATGYAGPASLLVDCVNGPQECHKLMRNKIAGGWREIAIPPPVWK